VNKNEIEALKKIGFIAWKAISFSTEKTARQPQQLDNSTLFTKSLWRASPRSVQTASD